MKCEMFGCSNESTESIQIAPGTRISLCEICADKEEQSNKKEKDLVIFFPLDNSGERPKIENVYIIKSPELKIVIPWIKDKNIKKSIMIWAIKEYVESLNKELKTL